MTHDEKSLLDAGNDPIKLRALLQEAENRMSLSNDALRTHGHQRSTWAIQALDADFRCQVLTKIAELPLLIRVANDLP